MLNTYVNYNTDIFTVSTSNAPNQNFMMHCGLDGIMPTSCSFKYTVCSSGPATLQCFLFSQHEILMKLIIYKHKSQFKKNQVQGTKTIELNADQN